MPRDEARVRPRRSRPAVLPAFNLPLALDWQKGLGMGPPLPSGVLRHGRRNMGTRAEGSCIPFGLRSFPFRGSAPAAPRRQGCRHREDTGRLRRRCRPGPFPAFGPTPSRGWGSLGMRSSWSWNCPKPRWTVALGLSRRLRGGVRRVSRLYGPPSAFLGIIPGAVDVDSPANPDASPDGGMRHGPPTMRCHEVCPPGGGVSEVAPESGSV